mgnify:CR=1 FL=1
MSKIRSDIGEKYYIILPESKYIYKNIQRKQRVIDNQQELEQKELDKKNGKLPEEESSDDSNVFNTRTLESLNNMTNTSVIKNLMGIPDDLNKNKKEDEDSDDSLDNIIKYINIGEKEREKQDRKCINLKMKICTKNNSILHTKDSRNVNRIFQYSLPLHPKGARKDFLAKTAYNMNFNNMINVNRNPEPENTMSRNLEFSSRIHSSTNSDFSRSFIPKEKKGGEKSDSKTKMKYTNNNIIKKNFLEMLLFNNSNDYVIKSFREFNSQIKNHQLSDNSGPKYLRNEQPKGILSTISVSKGDSLKNISKNSSSILKNIMNKKIFLIPKKKSPPQKINSYGYKSNALTSREKSAKKTEIKSPTHKNIPSARIPQIFLFSR